MTLMEEQLITKVKKQKREIQALVLKVQKMKNYISKG